MGAREDRKKEIAQRAKDIQQGLLDCLNTRNGRLFIWDRLEKAGVFITSFHPATPHLTSFAEGSRNEGLRLVRDCIRASPELYSRLLLENSERVTDERGKRDATDGRDDDAGDDDAASD